MTDPSVTYDILSPAYPDTYPDSVDCEWFLHVADGWTVDFMFEEFQTNITNCDDHMRLHAGWLGSTHKGRPAKIGIFRHPLPRVSGLNNEISLTATKVFF